MAHPIAAIVFYTSVIGGALLGGNALFEWSLSGGDIAAIITAFAALVAAYAGYTKAAISADEVRELKKKVTEQAECIENLERENKDIREKFAQVSAENKELREQNQVLMGVNATLRELVEDRPGNSRRSGPR